MARTLSGALLRLQPCGLASPAPPRPAWSAPLTQKLPEKRSPEAWTHFRPRPLPGRRWWMPTSSGKWIFEHTQVTTRRYRPLHWRGGDGSVPPRPGLPPQTHCWSAPSARRQNFSTPAYHKTFIKTALAYLWPSGRLDFCSNHSNVKLDREKHSKDWKSSNISCFIVFLLLSKKQHSGSHDSHWNTWESRR